MLRQQLKQLADQQQAASSRFTVVPFDGKSGTTRRPILVECTSTGIRFIPEDVTITAADIEGFTPQYNPLIVGSAALIDYWAQQQRQLANSAATAAGEPYVLLVVRPSGTLAYYVAMKMLSGLQQPYGYELVTDDIELQLPPVDPDAKAACEQAVRRALQERDQLLRTARSGLTGMPGGQGSPGGAPRSTTGSALGSADKSKEFSITDIERNSQVGERSWEDVDRFEGQEFRRGRSSDAPVAKATPQPASPSAPPASSPPRRLEGGADSKEAQYIADISPNSAAARRPDSVQPTAPRPSASSANPAMTPEGEAAPAFPDFSDQPKRRGEKSAEMPYEQLQRRRWGPHEPGASIGVEKPVTIHVDAERIVLAQTLVVPIPPGAQRNTLFNALLLGLDQLAQTWDSPGPGFFWVPSLRFVISPGGNVVYERIAPLVTRCGLSNSAEFTLEAAPTAVPETRR